MDAGAFCLTFRLVFAEFEAGWEDVTEDGIVIVCEEEGKEEEHADDPVGGGAGREEAAGRKDSKEEKRGSDIPVAKSGAECGLE